ncbi:MAG: site-specific integrase [Candidatus Azobacteroides sp.]|nr:site-specific integrase [Candidatus Azobacteroides sp.]
MYIKRVCQFLPDKEPDKPDAKLRYRIKWNHNKNIVSFNVGYRVDIAKWSTETQRCINNTTHGKKKTAANIINKEIQRFEGACEKTFASFELRGTVPDTDEFRNAFGLAVGRKSSGDKTFYGLFDEFTEQEGRGNSWVKATYQKMAAVKNHLHAFDENLTFEKTDEKGLNEYIAYLRDTLRMRNRTIEKQINLLKWFLRWSVRKGYNNNASFQTFKPKLKIEKNKVIFLDWDELMTVYNYKIPEEFRKLEKVRDVFCFCCFTSLRYSDAANLKRTDVFDGYISITTVKTGNSLKIELNNYSKAILDKYKNSEFPDNLALPIISNQKMNDALKELCKLCEIDTPVTITYYRGGERADEIYPKYELMSTHAARRTFICNALMFGISPQIVMKWTGHSDYSAMKPYIEVTDKAKEKAMTLFNK